MLWPAHAGGDADGALWACEVDDSGQLGLNGNENRHVFEQVGAGAFGARVVSAAARDVHSAALTEDGALWTWAAAGSGNWATMTGNAVWCQRRWRKRGSGAVRSVVPGAIIPREFLMFKQDCTLFIRSAMAEEGLLFFFPVESGERRPRPRHTCALAASVAGQEAFFSALAGHRCGVYRGGPRSCFPRSRPVLYRPHVVRARTHPASWRSALCSSTQGRIWPRLFTILFARLMSFLRKST